MTYEELKNLTAAIQSIATVGALMVGGYWTYRKFIHQREDFAFIEFTVDILVIGKQGGSWIVELIAYLENKGKVSHHFHDLIFYLDALNVGDKLRQSQEYGGQAYFPRAIENGRPWIPEGRYFIEPGIKAKYSYLAQVPEETAFLMLHGRFTYENQVAWHSAERTIPMPRELAESLAGSSPPAEECL